MELDHEIVFAFLDEDIPSRSFFRVLPLLTTAGEVQSRAQEYWPSHGALRVIPDHNEQRTFKERMLSMGRWCCIDLTSAGGKSGKIRPNKNFRPEQGEPNRFIVFSDVIRDLEQAPFFEVIAGKPEEAESLASGAITPRFYIQDGDTLCGPVSRTAPEVPGPAEPMEAQITTLLFPDGLSHTILCSQPHAAEEPETEGAPEDAAETGEESVPIGQRLEILDQNKGFEETLQDLSMPLSPTSNLLRRSQETEEVEEAPQEKRREEGAGGTPFRKAPVQTATPMTRNHAQQAVAQQYRSVPMAAPVPFDPSLPLAENPLEQAVTAVRAAWQVPEIRPQLVGELLAMEGMKRLIGEQLFRDAGQRPLMSHFSQQHLEELEAKRLEATVELEMAQRNLAAFRTKALQEASAKARRELDGLKKEEQALQKKLAQLREQIRRQEDEPAAELSREEIRRRVERSFDAAGIAYDKEFAAVWSALIAEPGTVGVVCADPAQCTCMLQEYAAILGWNCGHEAAGNAPALRLTCDPAAPVEPGERVLILTQNKEALAGLSVPIVTMAQDNPSLQKPVDTTPVSFESFQRLIAESPLSREEAQTILAPLFTAAAMTEEQLQAASLFARNAAQLLDGDVPAACDWALLLFLLPRLTECSQVKTLRPLLGCYPRTLARLG